MPNTGGGTVAQALLLVRPHVVLVALARGSATPAQKAQWRRQSVQQQRRQRTAKLEQYTPSIDPRHLRACKCTRRSLQRRDRHGIEHGLHRLDATAQPAYGAGQCHVETAKCIRSRLHAAGRLRNVGSRLERTEQAGQPGRKEVRKQAERSVALGAIPPRDAQALRRYPRIAAMAGKGATPARMQRARKQARITPLTVGDVHLGARLRSQRDLQSHSPTRRRASTQR